MRRLTTYSNVILALLGGALYLAAGVGWSRIAFARGAFSLDLGWILLAVLISRYLAFRLTENRALKHHEWLRVLWPAIPGFVLEGVSDEMLRIFRSAPGRATAAGFCLFSCLFLLVLIFSIASFEYEGMFHFASERDHVFWRRISYMAAVGISLTVIVRSAWMLVAAGGFQDVQTIADLESWLYICSLIVYVFLGLELFFPLLDARLCKAFER